MSSDPEDCLNLTDLFSPLVRRFQILDNMAQATCASMKAGLTAAGISMVTLRYSGASKDTKAV
jgi:hypothetical protein